MYATWFNSGIDITWFKELFEKKQRAIDNEHLYWR